MMFSERCSVVDHLAIFSVTNSGVVEIGDSTIISTKSKALAVQRQYEKYFGNEGAFDSYPIFSIPIPKQSMIEAPNVYRINECHAIQVHSVSIKGVASSGVVQIGSTNFIQGEARVKNIRQMADKKKKSCQ